MQVSGMGDQARSLVLRHHTTTIKKDLQTAASEVATGLVSDVARKQNGNMLPLVAIENTLRQLDGFKVATAQAASATQAMQDVFSQVERLSQNVVTGLLSAGTSGQVQLLDTVLQDTRGRFDSVISALNTKSGERTLFAGINSDGPAVANADTILAALAAEIVTAGATTAADIEAVVTSWFGAPTGFAALGYLGGASLSPLNLSADDRVTMGITAQDPALRDTLQAFALAALATNATLVVNSTDRAALALRAGESLIQAQTERVGLASQLGVTQGRIEAASVRNDAERATLETAQSALLSVDPYEAAVKLEAAQGQLETLYAITARLSRLSLVDFLR